MFAVIQAGGKGTRLKTITFDEIPKPMVPVLGKPLLHWQIEKLKENGICDFVFIIGHLGDVIKNYFGDGFKFGVSIKYIEEKEPLGTAGAFYYLKDILQDEDFILVYGDVFFDIDIKRMIQYHYDKKSEATLFVHPNSHPYDSDLVILNSDNKVCSFLQKNEERKEWYDNCVNAGFYILKTSICERIVKPEKVDFEKEIITEMMKEKHCIFGYRSPEYIKDLGTTERLMQVEQDVTHGLPAKRNLKNPQKCVFIDRDGTINKYKGLVYKESDFELESNVENAIKLLNQSEYLAIVITNQPVIARNLCNIDGVERIHKKMSTLFGQKGAYFDEVTFCPHHPDKGYPEENPVYKIECNCRKPKIGMMEKYVSHYNISLKNSWIVGDTTIDIQTGKNAGSHTALVLTGQAGKDGKYEVKPEIMGETLFSVVNTILNYESEKIHGLQIKD